MSTDFRAMALHCFRRLREMGARGTFVLNKNWLTIVGNDCKIAKPVNDNEAKP
jgi:hypothetical protein